MQPVLPPTKPVNPPRYLKRRPLLRVGLIIIAVMLTVVWMRFLNQESTDNPTITSQRVPEASSEAQTKAEAPPFADLTIPFLRAKQYQSSLAPLQKVGETGSYTSYLTSYSSDGLRINGLLTEPKGTRPVGGWPAVVFVHGYILPSLYHTQQNYSAYVDFLAKNGLAVFKIDLRGHDTSEGEASGAYYSGDYIVDALSAHAALRKVEFIDPEGIGLWGHSMAGNVTFRALAAKGDIKALVIWAGAVYSYTDFEKYGIADNSYRPPVDNSQRQRRRQELLDTYGNFTPDSDFWRQVPATNYLDGIKGAIQIHHATDDPVVPIGYSRDLMAILDKTTIPHELYEYSNGGHNLTGNTFTQAMERTVTFFKQNLQ